MPRTLPLLCCFSSLVLVAACEVVPDLPFEAGSADTETCRFVDEGYGPVGDVDIRTEVVVDGLETPWSVAFLPDGDMLVSERPGRVRLVEDGVLLDEPVAVLETAADGESGLLGLAVHPEVAESGLFYLYVTRRAAGGDENRVEQWRLAEDRRSARLVRTLLDGIPASPRHDGGRMRFGPDGLLYIATGDAAEPELSRDPDSLAGKILRVTDEGEVPPGNPFPGSPVYVLGVRNTQGFDFFDDGTLAIADHGPSGELLRTGGDEINVARAGDDLGWPTTWQCQEGQGLTAPVLAFDEALPPGGASFYTGDAIPAWRGALVVAALGARLLQVVRFDPDTRTVADFAVYLDDERGRLRDVVMGPDGDLYVTTSNCDGRGECPPEGDVIFRVTR